MKFYDSFHGVGGFRYGLEQAGMECVGGCEIDKYACQAYGVINDEDCRPTDIRTVDPIRLPDFDIFVGGFPCQDLSVAGKRKGFDGERSVLFFEILRICEVKRPTYILLENVTGLFSHNGGETFGTVLKCLDELGYDAEWQVHNSAAYVPQNRERVFIIGHLRGRGTQSVFPFGTENENDIEISRECILTDDQGRTTKELRLLDICPTLRAQSHGNEPKVLVVGNTNPSGNGMNGQVYDSAGLSPTLTTNKGEGNKIAIFQTARGFNDGGLHEVCPTITKNSWEHNNHLVQGFRIRKITPLEAFRLQSFPDWWYYKLKEHGISDSQLYKMAGNAVTSEVARQIGIRLMRSVET